MVNARPGHVTTSSSSSARLQPRAQRHRNLSLRPRNLIKLGCIARRRHWTVALAIAAGLLSLIGQIMFTSADAADRNTYKKTVTLWYDAFDKKHPKLLDRVLSADWVDIPPAPNQPPGPAGAKQILTELRTAFPDLKIAIRDILQDGNKVTVRSEISGTHKQPLMGFPAKNRKMTIQAIDIHEFKDGKIVRTWHTEDWLTGLHQLGVFDK
jgi:steroid delta-isomerase-like uncharacterized protein